MSVAERLPDPSPDAQFAADIVSGFSRRQKSLPSRYFYDARGSELFEEITRLPEYYPTRCEIAALSANAAKLMQGVGPGHALVELGSGSSRKTELLLDAAPRLSAYAPIDVSQSALDDARARLSARYPQLRIVPVYGDFTTLGRLPARLDAATLIGFFPGSTIGNFNAGEARSLLIQMKHLLGQRGRLIVGVDLVKDVDTLEAAYNDSAGVTAAFNLNILERINRSFGPMFDVSKFRHVAIYDKALSRIEMHLESVSAQTVRLFGRSFGFEQGETIHTENSHKYTIEGFRDLARGAGWSVNDTLTDELGFFSVHDLTVAASRL